MYFLEKDRGPAFWPPGTYVWGGGVAVPCHLLALELCEEGRGQGGKKRVTNHSEAGTSFFGAWLGGVIRALSAGREGLSATQ